MPSFYRYSYFVLIDRCAKLGSFFFKNLQFIFVLMINKETCFLIANPLNELIIMILYEKKDKFSHWWRFCLRIRSYYHYQNNRSNVISSRCSLCCVVVKHLGVELLISLLTEKVWWRRVSWYRVHKAKDYYIGPRRAILFSMEIARLSLSGWFWSFSYRNCHEYWWRCNSFTTLLWRGE